MKKTIAVLFALMTAAAFAGAENDIVINFSTPGPDKYADGTVVLDGEYYSLVWNAPDGTHKTVFNVPIAKDGKCPPVVFVIPEKFVSDYEGGTWSVYLLDTRVFATNAEGKTVVAGLAGSVAGENVKVAVTDGVSASSGSFATADADVGVSTDAYDLAALGVPTPKVTGIQIEGAYVVVTVADTVPFAGYTLQAGTDVTSFSVPADAETANGNNGGEIKLVTPKKDGAQFFKVSTVK